MTGRCEPAQTPFIEASCTDTADGKKEKRKDLTALNIGYRVALEKKFGTHSENIGAPL